MAVAFEKMVFFESDDTTLKSEMSDDEFWQLVDAAIISRLLHHGANPEAVLRMGIRHYPVLLVYLARAWMAPPPTTRHGQKFLQDLRAFFQKHCTLETVE